MKKTTNHHGNYAPPRRHGDEEARREIFVDDEDNNDDTYIHVAGNSNNTSPTSIADTSAVADDDDVMGCGVATPRPDVRRKGGYSRVRVVPSSADDGQDAEGALAAEDADDVFSHLSTTTPSSSSLLLFWKRIVHTTLLPDDCDYLRICGGGGSSSDGTSGEQDNEYYSNNFQLVESPAAVKLLKFCTLTFLGIALMHQLVRWMGWEHRESFTLADFFTYESNLVFLDAVFFYTVGRLHRQRGVDHLTWIFFVCLANFYNSYITTFAFLRQSFTLYSMHCSWSAALWTFVLMATPLVISLSLLHVVYAVRHGVFGIKLVELFLSVALLLLPLAASPYFHLHHWYAGWFVGMHANFEKAWWSRATMAWCWGCYINGIAVYGRDPVLTCGYALFISEANRCPFLDCYLDGIENNANNETDSGPLVQPMVQPDWRNCSADTYHP